MAAREELVERYLPLARELALRYSYTDEPFDDLLQVASLGLIKAIDRFDPGRGAKFTSYAAPTILGELKRHFRDKGWALQCRATCRSERSLSAARRRRCRSASGAPSPWPRSPRRSYTTEQVLEAAEAASSYEAASLDAPVSREGEEAALIDMLGDSDERYELVESRDAIAGAWSALPEVERRVVELRFMNDLTQREIGERIGYSQMHVSRLLRRALTRLESGCKRSLSALALAGAKPSQSLLK